MDFSQADPARQSLSVIITITSGSAHLARCIEALEGQRSAAPVEILVPFDPRFDSIGQVRARHPGVRFLKMEGPSCAAAGDPGLVHFLYDRRRAAGLAAARGDIVAITEDHAIPDPGWCSAIVEAHRTLPYGAVGGSVETSNRSLLNRAVFLCDFGRFEANGSEGTSPYLTDINISYKRTPLEKVRSTWCRLYHETAVHDALRTLGETLWYRPRIRIRYDRGSLHFFALLRERFAWARIFAGRRVIGAGIWKRASWALGSPLLPVILIARVIRTARHRSWGWMNGLRSLPSLWLLLSAWTCGEIAGYLTARPNACAVYEKSDPPEPCKNCPLLREARTVRT